MNIPYLKFKYLKSICAPVRRPSNVGVYDKPYVIRNFKIDYDKWKEFILLGRNEK